jgi:hypothetical protein
MRLVILCLAFGLALMILLNKVVIYTSAHLGF